MNIVFLGTPRSAVPSLEALLEAKHRIPLVVTQPDRPVGRSGTPQPPPVKRFARERGIHVVQPRRVKRPQFVETLQAPAPDVLVVVAYGRILPKPVLEAAPRGAINLHFSLLPRYRGAAPVQWALACGETVTGVSTMQIDEGLDEGDVLLQREVSIEPGEHAPALAERLSAIGARLLVETLERLERGELRPRPQDHSQATFAPLLKREHGDIDFGMSAVEIEGRVRGFDPWPGAWTLIGGPSKHAGKRLRLVDARALDGPGTEAAPGSVLALERDSLIVACGAGTRLALTRLQAEGRRAVDAPDAVNGRLLVPGDRLETPGAA